MRNLTNYHKKLIDELVETGRLVRVRADSQTLKINHIEKRGNGYGVGTIEFELTDVVNVIPSSHNIPLKIIDLTSNF